jgi:hypothetical protein
LLTAAKTKKGKKMSLVSIACQTCGETKVEFDAYLKQRRGGGGGGSSTDTLVTSCKITWFPLQKTAHVWFAAPALYTKHAITSFQRFYQDTFQELIEYYQSLFHTITWMFMSVLQKKRTLDTLAYCLEEVDPKVAALVKCLVFAKNNVSPHSKHGSKAEKDGLQKTTTATSTSSPRGSSTNGSSSRSSPRGKKGCWKKGICTRYRVDDGGTN